MEGVTPAISDNELYQLIRANQIEEFNERKKDGEDINFSGLDFRGIDLRGLIAQNIDFANAYFRSADLRGVDFRTCNLEGASIREAKISGVYFPTNLTPQEIDMSIKYGTRLRLAAAQP